LRVPSVFDDVERLIWISGRTEENEGSPGQTRKSSSVIHAPPAIGPNCEASYNCWYRSEWAHAKRAGEIERRVISTGAEADNERVGHRDDGPCWAAYADEEEEKQPRRVGLSVDTGWDLQGAHTNPCRG